MFFMTKANCFLTRTVSVAAVVLSLGLGAQAQIQNLLNNNSVASIDPTSSAGMFNWSVDGQNQLAQQWFWYRVGNAAEAPINAISAPSIIRPDAKTAYITYNNGSYSVEIDYVLTGQSAGSGQADIRESIRIHNYTDGPLDFHFFQYSDFNLLGVPNGDNVQLGIDNSGRFNEALQTKGPLLSSPSLTETEVTPGANHGEVGFFNTTLSKLNNGVADNLNDNAGPLGPGDVTWALQWDYTGGTAIAAGADALISKQKFLQVPEPTACALVGLAAAACIWRRRNA
jgi:hypothetical protein